MKRFLKKVTTFSTFSTFSALMISPIFLFANVASAQPTGLEGSYLGAGVSAGVTDGGDDDGTFGGNVQGRLDIPNVPISARGAFLFGGDSSAIMPIVSYDLPITNNANVYLGAGYSFVTSDNKVSPLGDEDSVVLTTGVEAEVAQNVVVYGDAKVGLDAYSDSNDAAVSLQLGAAYRF